MERLHAAVKMARNTEGDTFHEAVGCSFEPTSIPRQATTHDIENTSAPMPRSGNSLSHVGIHAGRSSRDPKPNSVPIEDVEIFRTRAKKPFSAVDDRADGSAVGDCTAVVAVCGRASVLIAFRRFS